MSERKQNFITRFSALTASVIAVFLLTSAARASIVTSFSDTMGNSVKSAASDHTLKFVTPSGVSAGGTMTITFPSGFNLTPLASPGDFDLAEGSTGSCSTSSFTDKTLASSASGSTWGVGISGQVVTFTSGTGTITASRCVLIEIGQNAESGTTGSGRIINPATAGSYPIRLAGTFGDTGTATAAITDSGIGVTAIVGEPTGGGGGGIPPPTAPVISNIRTLNVTETTASVLWDTNVASTSFVDYGTAISYGSTASVVGDVFNHNVPLAGLTPGTLYHYRVRSTGPGTPEGVSGDFTFTTLDTTPPVLSNIQTVNITGTSATITWDTNEDADSRIDYGISEPYADFVSSSTLTNAHSLAVTGLTPNTLYRYRVTSKDAAGNSSTSVEFTFQTLDTIPPTISDIFVDNITQTSARVNWTTNELSDSRAEYGPTVSYGSIAFSGTLAANHQLTLSSLTPGTLYHYRVISADAAGNAATSTDQTFTTLADTTPPANVSTLTATGGDGQVALSWSNPPDADFVGVRIQSSTTGFPTSPTSGTTVFDGSGTSFIDTGLTNGTTYYYTVFAYDSSGNFSSGALASATAADSVPPGSVTNFTITVGDSQLQLDWTNPVDADLAYVQIQRSTTAFPAGPASGTTVFQGAGTSYLDTGLTNGVTYYYSIFVRDTSGNFSSAAQNSAAPSPTPPPPAVCGNAVCEPPENPTSCPADCPVPPPVPPPGPVCGNAICEIGENVSNCPADCPAPPPAPPPVEVPPVTTPSGARIDRSQIIYFVQNRTIRLTPDRNGYFNIYPSLTLTVYVPASALPRPVKSMILNFAGGSYLFQTTREALAVASAMTTPELDQSFWRRLIPAAQAAPLRLAQAGGGTTGYVTDVVVPSVPGPVQGTIIVTYDNDTSDVVPFNVLVVRYGYVYESVGGTATRVSGATVTLFGKNAGVWTTWDGPRYGQINPQTTGSEGLYGYIVPDGEYYIEVNKSGYRKRSTAPFSVVANVITRDLDLELIRIPKSLVDVIIPGAPFAENFINIARGLGSQTVYITKVIRREIIEDPRVSRATDLIVIPAAAIITTAVVATAVQATSLISYLYFLLTQPILLLGRRKRKEFGTVYNALSKLPVDLAIVRLFRTNGKLVRTLVTDKLGRYAFLVDEGQYRIEASKPGFTFPSEYLKDKKEDAQYIDLYHGEEIRVAAGGAIITANVPLDPVEVIKTARRLVLESFGRRTQNFLALFSVFLTIFAFLLYRRPYLLGALAFQVALYFLFRRLARPKQPKNWGIVYDQNSKRPVPFAVARIVETQYNKVLESRVTDAKGRYNFLVGNNKYYVSVEKPGYEAGKTPEIDLTKAEKGGGVISIDIGIKPKEPTP